MTQLCEYTTCRDPSGKQKPCIFIVIPVHNRKELTRKCLASLRNQSWANRRIIIVDDGSNDGTREMIETEFKEVDLVRGDGSMWWTGAVNAGIEKAQKAATVHDYALLLNNDAIVSENYVEALLGAAGQVCGAIIGSVLVMEGRGGVISSGGVRINWWTAKYEVVNRGRELSDFPRNHLEEVSTLSGRGTLYPISIFREIGFFDSYCFQQCGDTELPRRAFLNGYRLLVSYDAVVKGIQSPEDRESINQRQDYHLSDLKSFLFDPRSNFRLRYRWYFAVKSLPMVRCFIYFICDLLRITYYFGSRLSLRR